MTIPIIKDIFDEAGMCTEPGGQGGKNTILGTDYEFVKPVYAMVSRMQDTGTNIDYSTIKTGNIHYLGPFNQGTIAMMPMGLWFANTMITKIEAGKAA